MNRTLLKRLILPAGRTGIELVCKRNAFTQKPVELIHHIENRGSIIFNSGKFARLADGCVSVKSGDTSVLVTSVLGRLNDNSAGPLTVEYRHKGSATGRIPTNFLRRDTGKTEQEIVAGRAVDRSLRPMFPDEFTHEVQIVCSLLAADGTTLPDILSINAASAALALSGAPWNGPVGCVRVGHVNGTIVVNPTRHEMNEAIFSVIVTANKEAKIVMLEGSGEVSNPDLIRMLKFGALAASDIAKSIVKLCEASPYNKGVVEDTDDSFKFAYAKEKTHFLRVLTAFLKFRVKVVLKETTHDKQSRDVALSAIRSEVIRDLKDHFTDFPVSFISKQVSDYIRNAFRQMVLLEGVRCDGRSCGDIRDLQGEVDLFKPLHGSALFQRGQTQVLCTVTFDSSDAAAKVDWLTSYITGFKDKNFMVHYEFPPFATNEMGRSTVVGRREIGHGLLAERALKCLIPPDFPFTIRLTSEVLESNGSSSMATVCGGSMALMDAGVPLKNACAGVAIGLVTEVDSKGEIQNHEILTDLMGIEDYFGDMDFKIAGTSSTFTALQMDVKLPGIPFKIVLDALDKGTVAKEAMIRYMKSVIEEPKQGKNNWPVMKQMDLAPHQRARLFGFQGRNVKKSLSELGITLTQNLEDSSLHIFAPNAQVLEEALTCIDSFIERKNVPDLQFGAVYTAKILDVLASGVILQLHPDIDPALLPNSQLDPRMVSHPSALGFEVGQEISVKYFGRDPVSGQMRLSRKAIYTIPSAHKNYMGSEKENNS